MTCSNWSNSTNWTRAVCPPGWLTTCRTAPPRCSPFRFPYRCSRRMAGGHHHRPSNSIDGWAATWPVPRLLPFLLPITPDTRASEDRNSSGPLASKSVSSRPTVPSTTLLDWTESRTRTGPVTRTFDLRARVAGVCACAATVNGICSQRIFCSQTEREKEREKEREIERLFAANTVKNRKKKKKKRKKRRRNDTNRYDMYMKHTIYNEKWAELCGHEPQYHHPSSFPIFRLVHA